jgi:hypothetical protein
VRLPFPLLTPSLALWFAPYSLLPVFIFIFAPHVPILTHSRSIDIRCLALTTPSLTWSWSTSSVPPSALSSLVRRAAQTPRPPCVTVKTIAGAALALSVMRIATVILYAVCGVLLSLPLFAMVPGIDSSCPRGRRVVSQYGNAGFSASKRYGILSIARRFL